VVSADRDPAPNFDVDLEIRRHFPGPGLEEWRQEATRSLQSFPLEDLTVTTDDQLKIRPLYTRADRPPMPVVLHRRDTGGWQACCPVDLREADEAVLEAARGLARGGQSLWLRLDRRSSSWGRIGIGVMARMLEVADSAPVYLDGRGVTPALAAIFAAAAEKTGKGAAALRGGFDFDPLASLAADGTLPWSLSACFDLMAEMVLWSDERAPGLRAVSVSTVQYAAAGATAVDELAYALATGVEYLHRLEAAGVTPDIACRRLRLIMPVGRDFFMELAKLRAVRALWARVADACGVPPGDASCPVHAMTSPRTLSIYDPWVNILRGTTHVFAAVAGGADVITVLPFDSALGKPDGDAHRLALNTSTILREECRLGHVTDPAAGSYFVDSLTHDLAIAAWNRFQVIEEAGGMVAAMRSGSVSRDLARNLSARREEIATHRELVTGVSTYPNPDEVPPTRTVADRSERVSPDDQETAVRRAFGLEEGSFGSAIASAGDGITLAELIEILPGRAEPEKIAALASEREGHPFESLRRLSDRHRDRTGERPRVMLTTIGPASDHRQAVDFATSLLAAGGVAAVASESVDDAASATAALRSSGSQSVIICAAPGLLADAAPKLARDFKVSGAQRVLVAQRPDEHEALWRASGVDGYLFPGCNAVAVIEDLLESEGVHHD
jgi:methylmalonyl-CoA mutase